MIKKFLTLATATAMAISAAAEGYQVNTLSARQGGMAHTGVAQKLGAESMYFNPAGMAFMGNTIDLQGSFNAVFPSASATLPDGNKYETDCDASTPLMFNAAFSIYDNLKAGISFYTPYGSGINWGTSWPGAALNQRVKLAAYTVQPTFSWRITDRLSVGAGLTLSWGNVNLDKGLISPSTMDIMVGLLKATGQLDPVTPAFNGTSPASINIQGTTDVAFGFNVGAMYDINDQITVGAQFRSKSMLKVKKGTASVDYVNSLAQGLLESELALIDHADFSSEMPMPWVLTFGASYRPVDKLLLAFDAQLTGWKAYKKLDISFLDPNLSRFDQHLEKNYHNSWAFRLGAQYGLTERFDIRAGLILDLTPVNKQHYNPETPGMTKIEPSVGLSFRPIKNLSIDLAMLYVIGLGADNAIGTYTDMLAPKINALLPAEQHLPLTQTFVADYKTRALVPSIGISYAFAL